MPPAPPRLLNIPNVISIARVLLVPAVMLLMATIHPDRPDLEVWNIQASFWAALLFGIASISDVIDGAIARHSQTVTLFGKLFDPMADKLLTLGALVMLIPLGRMPAWLAVLVLAREIAVTTLRSIASGEGIVMVAGKWGKMKNAFGSVALSFLLLYYPHYQVSWYHVGWVLFLISVVLGFGSGVQYGVAFFRAMANRSPGSLT